MTTLIPKISQLSTRVIRILGCNPGFYTLQGTNTYIVGTGKRRALIDCGEPNVPEYIENLKKVVNEQGISLSKIIISHWHPDHIGGTQEVLEHVADKDCQVFKYKDTQHDSTYLDQFKLNYLKDEDEIAVEGATIKTHWTPGHSADHLVLYLAEEDSLFSGDCILGEGSVTFEDLLSYMGSLNRIMALKPKKLYPGHGPVVENALEKIKEYIDNRNTRERQIVETLEKTAGYMRAMNIVKVVYGQLPPKLMFGAEDNVRHHLEKLFKENRIEVIRRGNSVEEEIDREYRIKRD